MTSKRTKRRAVLLLFFFTTLLTAACTREEEDQTAQQSAALATKGLHEARVAPSAGRPNTRAESRAQSRPSERSLTKILAAAMGCRRAESLRGTLTSDPLVDNRARSNLTEADRLCADTPGARTADVEGIALKAAQMGNAAAASCFVSGALRAVNANPADRQRSEKLYAKEAPALLEQGIAAGDWSMVAQAAAINGERNTHSPYLPLPAPDPAKGYLYAKLLEFGAGGDEKLDLRLVALERAKSIDASTRKKADLLASELYRSNFQQSGTYSQEALALCVDF